MSISDASRSNTTGALPVVTDDRRHTSPRAWAMASHRPANLDASSERTVRHSVESDGTTPNSIGCTRSRSMSEHASPPPANINIACTNTLPRSCIGSRPPGSAIRADNKSPTPNRSANAPKACNPT
jgi:hypothetical protein